VVVVHYAGVPNRVDAYVDGQRVAAAASAADVNSAAAHGTSFHDVDTTLLKIVLKGPRPVDLLLAPVISLGLGLGVTISEFFATGRDGLVNSIALLFGIPASRIRVPQAGTAGRRLSSSSDAQIQVLIEGGAPTQVTTSNAATVESSLELDLTLQSFTNEMQALQANLSVAAQVRARPVACTRYRLTEPPFADTLAHVGRRACWRSSWRTPRAPHRPH
jgi:hypothetical protein